MRHRAWIVAIVLGGMAHLGLGQPAVEALQKENADLKARMAAVEKALADKLDKADYQKAMAKEIKKVLAEQPKTDQWASAMAANTQLEIYGFLRAEATEDSRKTNGGYFAFYTLKDGPTGRDGEMNITARNTRLGIQVNSKEGNVELSGKLETDFGTAQVPGTAEISATPRLRQAYIQAKLPCATFILGQTWDIFSPLFPMTDNVGLMWDAGNPGYRHPQFRVEREWVLGPGKLLTQVALSRAIGGDFAGAGGTQVTDGRDDGGVSNQPDLQSRIAYSTKLLTQRDTTFGVSGVWGRREVETVGLPDVSYSACGISLDMVIPIADKMFLESDGLTFRGEWYRGRGLGGYYGNAGQYFDAVHAQPIEGDGGWGELDYQINKANVVRAGWGMDCVDPATLSSNSEIRSNSITFVNYSHNITANFIWTIEYQYILTQYFQDSANYDDNRLSTSFTLNF